MIDWKNRAIEAAWNTLFQEPYDGTGAPMIAAALDAAIKAQKEVRLDGHAYHAPSYERGRAEALEEAANILEANAYACNGLVSEILRANAAAIRTLKETKG